MIYVFFVGILLLISFIVWLIYKIGYIDGKLYGYEKGLNDALLSQIEEISELCEDNLKELKEDEKGKEAAVDDL